MNLGFRARLEPERPAVLWRGEWLSYSELDRQTARLAAELASAGVRAGDRVALLAHNHPGHLHAIEAAGRHGWIHAPLNHRLPPAQLARALRDLEPRALLVGPGCEESARALAADLPEVAVVPLEGRQDSAAPPPEVRPDPDAPRMLLLTGGTTGTPKAAVITNRGYETNLWDTVAAWGLGPHDATVVATPMFHAAVNALATPLLAIGGRAAIQERFEPASYLALAAETRASILFLVPTMFGMVVETPSFAAADLSAVRFAIAGGSPCPPAIRAAFRARGVRFRLGYGMTEAGVNCFAVSLDEAERKPATVGRPVPHLEAVVRDPDGRPVAPGETGELTLRGPQVTPGYWRRPAETAGVLRDLPGEPGGRWLFTGDLARADADGALEVVGRRKDMFVSGGENVYPAEVERHLHDHPAVLEAAVLGVPDDRWGEVGLACVVARPGPPAPDAGGLRAFLRERLPGYAVPARIELVPELPKSAAGKVLKRELLERHLAGSRSGA